MGRHLTVNEVIDRIHSIHGDKYSFPYIENEYTRFNSVLTLICPIHGKNKVNLLSIFSQNSGCRQCGYERAGILSAIKTRKSIDEIYSQLHQIHGDKFSYPFITDEYKNSHSRITVICKEHGSFSPVFQDFVRSKIGCPECFKIDVGNRLRRPIEDIREILYKKHGDRYIFPYLDEEYKSPNSLITGICSIHGEFSVLFCNFMRSREGCPKCGHLHGGKLHRNVSIQPGLADYERYHLRLPIDDNPTKGPHGELQVRCKMCQQLMVPTVVMVRNRIGAINSLTNGDCNFYCSDECKQRCDVFGKYSDTHILAQQIDNYEAKIKLARNCQLQSKSTLRQIQMDAYGYHYCEKCGKGVDNPELHHTIEVAKDPAGAITPAGHMLVCTDCHKEFTVRCR